MITQRNGFTLLEILVSIAIIGVLSSILYVGFNSARDNAKNKALMAEVKELQLAIEVYRAQNGSYPPGGTYPGALQSTVVAGGFIAELPEEGRAANTNCAITYSTGSSNEWYKLTATDCIGGDLEITVDTEMASCPSSCGGSCGTGGTNKSFAVYSLGGQCE